MPDSDGDVRIRRTHVWPTCFDLQMAVNAVATTGIYCQPGCVARPDPRNVAEFAVPAAAEAAGYRACHRCRPYRDDEPPGVIGPGLVCRAVQMVCDGALDEGSEAELAADVGVSARHLRRLFTEYIGVTPDALARSRRAHFARRLLDETDLSVSEVAFASGYGSVRQLQRACADTFGESPSALRARRRSTDLLDADSGLRLRLWHASTYDWGRRLRELDFRTTGDTDSGRAAAVDGNTYRYRVDSDAGEGTVELRAGGPDHLEMHADLRTWDALVHTVRAARRIAGLDETPVAA
ncbi:MAG: helix-turn-helix domain-containing protein [Microthrixaceae bacterium]